MVNYDYLYDKSYYGKELYEDHRRDYNLYWRVIPNGIVLPNDLSRGDISGGLMDEECNYIDGSGLHRGEGKWDDISGETATELDEDIVFLGAWPQIWGHCLTDNIRRLWVLNNEEFMSRYGHLRFVYVPLFNMNLDGNFRELLDIIGAGKISLEPVTSITRFRNIILPDECFWMEDDGTRFFSREYVDIIDQIRKYGEEHFTESKDKKVYFTYRRFPSYRTIGEKYLERFFSRLGYKIVSPEKYSFTEQLNILLNCEEYASTVGSISHNGVFLRDGAKMYLIPRAYFIPEYQLALDQVHDIDITYIDSSLSFYVNPKRQWEGPFNLIISHELEECLGQVVNFKESKLDFHIYRYLGFVINNKTDLLDYYRSVYRKYLPVEPKWDGRENLITKLFRVPKIRNLIVLLRR